jgi:hypothetical protein
MSPWRITIGLLLLALGGLFLLDQVGYVDDAGRVIGDWWPLVIIVPGVLQLTANPRAWLGPSIVTLIGVALLIGELGLVRGSVFDLLWPLVLIGIGASILLNRAGRVARGGESEDSVDRFVAFAGQEVVNHSTHFHGGSLNAMFGGIDLDLREAELAPEGANLDAFAAFGGVSVRVPKGWRVNVTGLPLFGGLDNKTLQNGHLPEDAPRLNVNATALFGGVEVKY